MRGSNAWLRWRATAAATAVAAAETGMSAARLESVDDRDAAADRGLEPQPRRRFLPAILAVSLFLT